MARPFEPSFTGATLFEAKKGKSRIKAERGEIERDGKKRKKRKVCIAAIFSKGKETLKRLQSHPNHCPLSHRNTGIPVVERSIAFFSRAKASRFPSFTLHYLLIVPTFLPALAIIVEIKNHSVRVAQSFRHRTPFRNYL